MTEDFAAQKIKHDFCGFLILILLFSCSQKESGPPPEMVLVPEGEFIMGNGESESKVYLKPYLIDEFTVMNKQYKEFVEAAKHAEPKGWALAGYDKRLDDYPVVFTDYDDAEAYCGWLGKRLPTEEEWEKAARGTDGRKYPWGNHFDKKKANTSLSGIIGTVSASAYGSGKSPYGLYNMAGNVWEWTKAMDNSRKNRTVKGGSWGLSHRFSRTFSRIEYMAKDKTNNIGFRCAKDY